MRYAILNEDNSITRTDDFELAYKNPSMARRRIKQEIYKGFFISSIFLPLNHNWAEIGPPHHFECYVFPEENGEISSFSEVWGQRSSCVEDLIKDHEEAKRLIDSGEITK